MRRAWVDIKSLTGQVYKCQSVVACIIAILVEAVVKWKCTVAIDPTRSNNWSAGHSEVYECPFFPEI